MEAKIEYMKWHRNKFLSREELEYLKSFRDDDEKIEELFGKDLNFGTAGVRGVVGMGMSRINKYQVARATQAFSNNLIRKAGGRVGKGIAVGFDTRKESQEFAEIVARVLLGNGIAVAAFKSAKSVPQLSYAVRYLNLEGGIMVTASHNPKEYNGLKFYNSHGAQLSPEEMEPVIKEFVNIQNFNQVHAYIAHLRLNSIHNKIGPANDTRYRNAVLECAVCDDFDKDLGIVYSPLHGTGAEVVPELLKERGFNNVFTVAEQMKTDGDFSTVEVPNPMDPAALDMAVALAKEKNADIVLATDPDFDRVGVGVKTEAGDYQILTGNQIGALLLDYIIRYKKDMPENPVMVQTVVTGLLGKAVAEKAGVKVKETLTGFKYIGEFITQCEEGDDNFIFGYEESHGYLSGTHGRDKDAGNACMLFAEMSGVYKKEGTDVLDRLAQLYDEFGYFDDSVKNVDYDYEDYREEAAEVMQAVRDKQLREIAGEVVSVTDFMSDETGLPKENVIKYEFADGSFAAIRPSGTEPKLRIYYSIKGESREAAESRAAKVKEEMEKMV